VAGGEPRRVAGTKNCEVRQAAGGPENGGPITELNEVLDSVLIQSIPENRSPFFERIPSMAVVIDDIIKLWKMAKAA
jgi:hypothetical protein